jgi:RNA polymerase sigma factor (sigma-70 family)
MFAGERGMTSRIPSPLELAFVQGRESAFEELVAKNAPRLLDVCRRLVQTTDEGQIDEFFQDVLIRLWSECAKFNPEACGFFGWAKVVAKSLRLEQLRKKNVPSSRNSESSDQLRGLVTRSLVNPTPPSYIVTRPKIELIRSRLCSKAEYINLGIIPYIVERLESLIGSIFTLANVQKKLQECLRPILPDINLCRRVVEVILQEIAVYNVSLSENTDDTCDDFSSDDGLVSALNSEDNGELDEERRRFLHDWMYKFPPEDAAIIFLRHHYSVFACPVSWIGVRLFLEYQIPVVAELIDEYPGKEIPMEEINTRLFGPKARTTAKNRYKRSLEKMREHWKDLRPCTS